MKKRLAVLIVLVAIVVIALLWWRENRRYDGPVQQVTAGAEQIARGRYLAQAADCAACHTASGGRRWPAAIRWKRRSARFTAAT